MSTQPFNGKPDPRPGTAFATLAERWRREAQLLRQYGCTSAACSCEKHAEELEAAARAEADALLTLTQAARESGYSEDHLQRLVAQGRIPNAGRRNAPRVRRGDLPSKPHGAHPGTDDEARHTRLLRDIVTSKFGA